MTVNTKQTTLKCISSCGVLTPTNICLFGLLTNFPGEENIWSAVNEILEVGNLSMIYIFVFVFNLETVSLHCIPDYNANCSV